MILGQEYVNYVRTAIGLTMFLGKYRNIHRLQGEVVSQSSFHPLGGLIS